MLPFSMGQAYATGIAVRTVSVPVSPQPFCCCSFLRALEVAGCSEEEHALQYGKALEAGLMSQEDYTEVSKTVADC